MPAAADRVALWGCGLALVAGLFSTATAQDRLLFVRGADRSGGFLEAGNDAQRTEQLADIFNASTSGGNHGWAQLRLALEGEGYIVEQITETAENGSGPSEGLPVPFEAMDLSVYAVVVLGSNNAVYGTASIDAIETYIRQGGGVLFISDANFGGDWSDALREPLNNSAGSAFWSENSQIVGCRLSDSGHRHGRGMQPARCGFSGKTHRDGPLRGLRTV